MVSDTIDRAKYVLAAVLTLGVAFAVQRAAQSSVSEGLVAALAACLLGCLAYFARSMRLPAFAAVRRGSFNGLHRRMDRCISGQGIFPAVPELHAAREEISWFAEAVGRIYNCDFVPGRPPSIPVRPLPELGSLLETVKRTVIDQIGKPGEFHENVDDPAAARALCAADFDPSVAAQYMVSYLDWRSQVRGAVSPPLTWLRWASVLIPFEDRFGRPVVVIRARCHEPQTPQQTPHLLERGYRATMDAVIAHCLAKRSSTISKSNPLEQYVAFIDLREAGRRNFSLATIKMMKRESDTHYADRLANVYILFPNRMFQILWQVAQPLLHPRTQQKLQLIPAEQVPSFMRDMIGKPEVVPSDYGGSAEPWPLPPGCRTLEHMGGELAANIWEEMGTAPPELSLGESRRDLDWSPEEGCLGSSSFQSGPWWCGCTARGKT